MEVTENFIDPLLHLSVVVFVLAFALARMTLASEIIVFFEEFASSRIFIDSNLASVRIFSADNVASEVIRVDSLLAESTKSAAWRSASAKIASADLLAFCSLIAQE